MKEKVINDIKCYGETEENVIEEAIRYRDENVNNNL
jgi:hypothetical protein